jgi:hypothetical protein
MSRIFQWNQAITKGIFGFDRPAAESYSFWKIMPKKPASEPPQPEPAGPGMPIKEPAERPGSEPIEEPPTVEDDVPMRDPNQPADPG